ncbi:hypothetical protein EYC80_002649 [Monilinia laxa]|uniref:40S ribosomal protein S18 n=1 Tax=Monilinia laxa TaxID=61186 RepID=A0A5N6K4P9_MONLA|nr:hypothetical protein EYC80_002649 [Monilinia laxa]
MSLVTGEKSNFQYILRQKVQYALTKIKGVGRRYSNLVCKKADVDLNKRAGELTSEELERIVTIIQNPTQYKIPSWFLNRQRDIVDGKDSQVLANGVDSKLRDDLERLKKIRAHRGLRHYWGLRVRGQHSKTTGRRVLEAGGFTGGFTVVVLVSVVHDVCWEWLGCWNIIIISVCYNVISSSTSPFTSTSPPTKTHVYDF